EPDSLARPSLADPGDVRPDHGGDLRVATGRLAVDEEDDRLALSRHLDSPERDPVRDDVVAPGVLDHRSLQTIPHPVGLRGDLVRAVQEGADARRREPVVLGPEDDAALPLRRVRGPPGRGDGPPGAGVEGRTDRAQLERVALLKGPALDAAQAAPQVGRARSEGRGEI